MLTPVPISIRNIQTKVMRRGSIVNDKPRSLEAILKSAKPIPGTGLATIPLTHEEYREILPWLMGEEEEVIMKTKRKGKGKGKGY